MSLNPRFTIPTSTAKNIDPLQHTTSYTYDSRDRLIQATYADGSTEYFDYDANSNPTKRTET